jgi:hypothetical protein
VERNRLSAIITIQFSYISYIFVVTVDCNYINVGTKTEMPGKVAGHSNEYDL